MALHAVENINDAYVFTRKFLTPVDRHRWLALALVAFFVGGTGGYFPSFQFNTGGTTGENVPLPPVREILPYLVAGAIVVLTLLVVFGIISAVMEFVLVESLRQDEVLVRRYWSERWRQGMSLFGFRAALALLTIAVFAVVVGGVFWMFLTDIPAAIPLVLLLVGIPILLVVGFVGWLVNWFTTVFAVPLMVKFDGGVLDAWRRLWPSVRAAWKQYLAYVGVGLVLTLAGGTLATFVIAAIALVVLVPFVLVGAVAFLALGPVGLVVVAVLAVVFGLVLLVISAVVHVPVVTYLRSYALLVLGDIEASFDLVPDQRAAIRED